MQPSLIDRKQQPLLMVISGPSGVGKDSVIQRMKARGLPFHFVVTVTTRPKRPGEVEGADYHFVSHDEFAEMIEHDELLEHAFVYNDYKGIPKAQVQAALDSGQDVVMRVDVQGAETIRQLSPQSLLVFLAPGSEEELVERLKARKTESGEGLKLRIATARQEFRKLDLFDYFVINAEFRLEDTVDTIMAIVEAEHHRTHPRQVSL